MEIEKEDIEGKGIRIDIKGKINVLEFNGDIEEKVERIENLGEMEKRNVEGRIDVKEKGMVRKIRGELKIDLDGKDENVRKGKEEVERIIEGEVNLRGEIGRRREGF